MQKMPRLVLQSPTTFFPGNAHPQRMLGDTQHGIYCIFLDVRAHHCQPNDCAYVIAKIERVSRAPFDVDPGTVVPKARVLLRGWVPYHLSHDETQRDQCRIREHFSEGCSEVVDTKEPLEVSV